MLQIKHKATTFKSPTIGETFPVKFHLTCSSSCVIYLIECKCGTQYVGRTIQQLSRRLNKHRGNVKNKFLLQSVSRHCAHPDDTNSITILPIDHVDTSTHNRFATLKKLEVYWMCKPKTLCPRGMNEISEIINK